MNYLNYLSKEDAYEVRLESMLASYDRDILVSLYQPMVGYGAISLYFTLWSEVKRREYEPLRRHNQLMQEMGIEITAFINARRLLEAIGLLRTYKKKLNKSTDVFLYELYAPKAPEEFFLDPVYKILLTNKIGKKEVEKLALIYNSAPKIDEDYKDVSAKIYEMFDLSNNNLEEVKIRSTRGRKTLVIKSDFDTNEFLKQLKNTTFILPEALLPEEISDIERLSTLFGIDILTMVEIVSKCYNPDTEKHLDTHEIAELCNKYKSGINIVSKNNEDKEYSSQDQFGELLNQMSQFAPFEFLKLRQNYTNPAPADVKIINILSEKYGFSNGVINAIIDYTLKQCDDSLPLAYVEKLAAKLSRKNVTTALGACNALKGGSKKKEKKEEAKDTEIVKKEESIEDFMKSLEDL